MPENPIEQGQWLIHNGQPYSPEAAARALADFDANKDKVAAALGGDVAKQQERRDLWLLARGHQPGAVPVMPLDEGAIAQQMGEREAQIHEARLDAFAQHVRMTPELRFQMSRRLATKEQSEFANAEKARLLRDKAFGRRVLDGDADAVDRWVKITQVAAAPVAPTDYDWGASNG